MIKYKKLITNLSSLQSITPRQIFKSHVENVLISSLPSKTYRKDRFFLGLSIRLAFALLVFIIFGSSGLVLASQESNPGTVLYPIKQIVQDIKIAATSNPSSKALLHVEKAEDKIQEIRLSANENNEEKLEERASDYKEIVGEVIEDTQNIEAQNNNAAHSIVESLGNQTQTLKELQNSSPANAQPALENAIEASQKGLERVQEALQNNPNNQGNELPDASQNGQTQGQNTSNEHKKGGGD